MATSSITGADRAPSQATGRDVEALGPSDSSDSGSDVQGELDLASPADLDEFKTGTQPGLDSDSDSGGTGERGSALLDEAAREGNDILPDRVQDMAEAAEDDGAAIDAELDLVELDEVDDLISREDDETDAGDELAG
ncbi:MAG TPA: hypothetical protein VGE16_05785 [Albitalea sp.]